MAPASNPPKVTAPIATALLPHRNPPEPYPVIISVTAAIGVALVLFVVTHWKQKKKIVYQGGDAYVATTELIEEGGEILEMMPFNHGTLHSFHSINSTRNAQPQRRTGRDMISGELNSAPRSSRPFKSQPSRSTISRTTTSKSHTSGQQIARGVILTGTPPETPQPGSSDDRSVSGSSTHLRGGMMYDGRTGSWMAARGRIGVDEPVSLDAAYSNSLHTLPASVDSHLNASQQVTGHQPARSSPHGFDQHVSPVPYTQDPRLQKYGPQRQRARTPPDPERAPYSPKFARLRQTPESSGHDHDRNSTKKHSHYGSEFGVSIQAVSAVGTEVSEDHWDQYRQSKRRYR